MKLGKIAGARNVVFFQYKMLVLSAKSNLVCAAGCGLTGSFSDHGRIILGLVSDQLRDGNDVSAVFRKFLLDFAWSLLRGRRSTWLGSSVTLVALHRVNDVSYVSRIKHASHLAWQAQYLVSLEGDTCCSVHCK